MSLLSAGLLFDEGIQRQKDRCFKGVIGKSCRECTLVLLDAVVDAIEANAAGGEIAFGGQETLTGILPYFIVERVVDGDDEHVIDRHQTQR